MKTVESSYPLRGNCPKGLRPSGGISSRNSCHPMRESRLFPSNSLIRIGNSYTLNYGKDALRISIPETRGVSVLDPKGIPALENPQAELREKLLTPAGSEGLPSLCRGGKNACIVVSDKTRFLPYGILLEEILRVMDECGVVPTILVACGMHSPTSGEDLEEMLGKEIVKKYRVINHDARAPEAVVDLGRGPSGVPVHVNRCYYESDLKVLTGLIEPHFMAGFSGGRKSVCPGISGLETIKFVHSAKILDSPRARAGCLEMNPCSEAMFEAAGAAGCDFIVNVTLNRDRKITGIFCGGLKEAFLEGVTSCLGQCSVPVEGEFDVVVTSGGGHPLDRNFYQTVKALVGAADIVKEGGVIICASRCTDGIGSREFRELLYGMKNTDEFMKMIFSDDYFCVDQWEVQELIKVLRKCAVKLYSGALSDDETRKCGCEPVSDLDGEIYRAVVNNKNARVAVMPGGPHVLARRQTDVQ